MPPVFQIFLCCVHDFCPLHHLPSIRRRTRRASSSTAWSRRCARSLINSKRRWTRTPGRIWRKRTEFVFSPDSLARAPRTATASSELVGIPTSRQRAKQDGSGPGLFPVGKRKTQLRRPAAAKHIAHTYKNSHTQSIFSPLCFSLLYFISFSPLCPSIVSFVVWPI
jgi:hypothetical protein